MIGQKIRYFRRKRNLTLEHLSEGICSVSYLSKLERGEKGSEEIVNLLCAKLNIPNKTESIEEKKNCIDN